jgi:hypothetical protein
LALVGTVRVDMFDKSTQRKLVQSLGLGPDIAAIPVVRGFVRALPAACSSLLRCTSQTGL